MSWYFKGINTFCSFMIIWGVILSVAMLAFGVVPYANLTLTALSAVILAARRIRYEMEVRR